MGDLLSGSGVPEKLRSECAGSAGSGGSPAAWERKGQRVEGRGSREDREPPAGACEPGSLCLRVRSSRQAGAREPLDKAHPLLPPSRSSRRRPGGRAQVRLSPGEAAGAGLTGAGGSSPASGVRARPLVKRRLRERLAAKRRRHGSPVGTEGWRGGGGWLQPGVPRPRRGEPEQPAAGCGEPPSRRSAAPYRERGGGPPALEATHGIGRRGRRQGDSPGLGGTGLVPPLPPGGGAVRLFWLPAASGGRGDTERRRGCAGADRGCRRKMVLLGKQHPPLPRLSPARAVCSPLIARRGHPAPAAPPSRDGYIQRLLSRNFPGTASCDRTRSGASAAIAASRGRRTEPPPLSRRGSGRRTLPRGPPASSSCARGAAGDVQAKIPFMTKEGGNNISTVLRSGCY
ncbi:uncharacterized protein LOC143694066 [Agelaius phoeniceus]|uniref:uncharacterized protein LOC143694066 n=1 Tax=Agelaius phoeniceus TaxID=39638 RepID=UPI0040551A83